MPRYCAVVASAAVMPFGWSSSESLAIAARRVAALPAARITTVVILRALACQCPRGLTTLGGLTLVERCGHDASRFFAAHREEDQPQSQGSRPEVLDPHLSPRRMSDRIGGLPLLHARNPGVLGPSYDRDRFAGLDDPVGRFGRFFAASGQHPKLDDRRCGAGPPLPVHLSA
jgi:hypothetical protein